MKTVYALYVAKVTGCTAIGAWLVIEGHPWFGAAVMIAALAGQFTAQG